MSFAEPGADDPDDAIDLEFVTADVETTCTICYAEFLDKSDLDIHVKQVHKGGSKHCDFCPETYTDMIDYATHIRDNHLQEIGCCNYCSKVMKDSKELSYHQKLHTSYSDSYYSCSQCVGLFSTTRQLELHELLHHEDTPDAFHLPCMVHLSSILNCKATSVLQASGDCFFICSSCDFTAVDLKNYRKHLLEGNCTSLICDMCSSFFKNRRTLIGHLTERKTKCDAFIENVKCINCKEHINYLELRNHLKSCHMIKCTNCDNSFQTVEQLSLHQQKDHPRSISNTSRCTFCNKMFVGQIAMKKHVKRSHRPYFHLYKYMCKTCGSIFPHPQKLFAHYFVQHRELLPYTCKVCDKTFRVRKQFTIHIKMAHKGEGFVEFDEQYHVYFTSKKPDKPFIPKCVIKDNLDTDTDGEEKEKKKKTPKPKMVTPRPKIVKYRPKTKSRDSSSEDEPLEQIRKRSRSMKSKVNIRTDLFAKKSRKQLTCQVCSKYCYTYQNYLNHMSVHKKSDKITCVKCSSTFRTAKELEKHTQAEHSTSLLTETLKKVLEKRKLGPEPAKEETMSQKFTKTIKKVKYEKGFEAAKILPAPEKDLSVKKFLENFTPDINAERPKLKIESALTIKKYESPYYRKESIRMSKFEAKTQINLNKPAKLKMPQKFIETGDFKPEISISLVQKPFDHDYDMDGGDDHQNYFDDEKDIPEVAQEVMLEDTVEDRPQNTPKIVLPKLPIDYPDIHVATLQPQAPYFKITKVTDQRGRRSKNKKIPAEKPPTNNQTIQLKDGTKLVSTNPLAHLLGDKHVDEIIKPVKSSYVPKNKIVHNVQGAIVEALQKLDKTLEQKRVKAPRKRKVHLELPEKKKAPRSKKKARLNSNVTREDVETSQDTEITPQNREEAPDDVNIEPQDTEEVPEEAEIAP